MFSWKKIPRALLITTYLLFTASTAVGEASAPFDFSRPLSSIVAEPYLIEDALVRECPQFTMRDTIETFVSKKFFEKCIPKPKDPTESTSPFFSLVGALEGNLRRELAEHWLSLNMSQAEIANRTGGHLDLKFKPLKLMRITNFVGHKAQTKWLPKHGINTVGDFEAAYAAEMQLPENERWLEFYRERYHRVYPIHRGIQAERDAAVAIALSDVNRDTVRAFLEATMYLHEDKHLQKSCQTLLDHLNASDASPEK